MSRLSWGVCVLSGLMLTGCQSLVQMGSQKRIFPDVSPELLNTKPDIDGPYVTYAESDFSYKSYDVSLVYRNTKTGERWWVNACDMNRDGEVNAQEIHSFYYVAPSTDSVSQDKTYSVVAFKNNNLTSAVYDKEANRLFSEEKRCNIRGEAGHYANRFLTLGPARK